jgi:hypothetical protein
MMGRFAGAVKGLIFWWWIIRFLHWALMFWLHSGLPRRKGASQ